MRKIRVALWFGLTSLVFLSTAVRSNESGGGGRDAQYLPLESVLVNLEGKRHYLRADIQLLVDSAEHVERMKVHMPAIRHSLIMLFSGRNPEQVAAVDERERLRQSAKEEVKKALAQYGADDGLQDLFFTDFLVQ